MNSALTFFGHKIIRESVGPSENIVSIIPDYTASFSTDLLNSILRKATLFLEIERRQLNASSSRTHIRLPRLAQRLLLPDYAVGAVQEQLISRICQPVGCFFAVYSLLPLKRDMLRWVGSTQCPENFCHSV